MLQRIIMLLPWLTAWATASCGFHPQGTMQMPHQIKTLILESQDPYGPFTRVVCEHLRLNGIVIIKNAKLKDIPCLSFVSTIENQDAASIFQNGKAAEYQMMLKVQVKVLLPVYNSHVLSFSANRSFFDNPLTALAKDSEQEIMRQEMYDQVAQQLVCKLLTLHMVVKKSYPQDTSLGIKINNDNLP